LVRLFYQHVAVPCAYACHLHPAVTGITLRIAYAAGSSLAHCFTATAAYYIPRTAACLTPSPATRRSAIQPATRYPSGTRRLLPSPSGSRRTHLHARSLRPPRSRTTHPALATPTTPHRISILLRAARSPPTAIPPAFPNRFTTTTLVIAVTAFGASRGEHTLPDKFLSDIPHFPTRHRTLVVPVTCSLTHALAHCRNASSAFYLHLAKASATACTLTAISLSVLPDLPRNNVGAQR